MDSAFTSDNRQFAWNSVGLVFEEACTSLEDAVVAAGLNWGTYRAGLTAKVRVPKVEGLDENTPIEYENQELIGEWSIHRDIDNQPLGLVGARFEIVNNIEGLKRFQPVLDAGEAVIESAGSLKHGEVVFIMARMKSQGSVVEGDEIEQRVLLSLAHNTKRQSRYTFLTTRVCDKTVLASCTISRKDAYAGFKSTKNVHQKMNVITKRIAMAGEQFQKDLAGYQKLSSQSITEEQFKAFLTDFFVKELVKTSTKQGVTTSSIKDLTEYPVGAQILRNFTELPSCAIPGVANTRWAAYNAFAYYINHQALDRRRQGSATDTKIDGNLDCLWFTTGAKMLSDSLRGLIDLKLPEILPALNPVTSVDFNPESTTVLSKGDQVNANLFADIDVVVSAPAIDSSLQDTLAAIFNQTESNSVDELTMPEPEELTMQELEELNDAEVDSATSSQV